MPPSSRLLLQSCGLAISAALAHAQCSSPVWSSQFGTPAAGLSSVGLSLAVFDPDGTGPLPAELYVAGYFQTAGGIASRGIARWNGQTFAPVGGGTNGTVQAIGIFDADGPGPGLPVLVAAGAFTSAGGVPAVNVAAWNGAQWSAIGAGLPAVLNPIGVIQHDPDGPGPLPPVLLIGAEYIDPGLGSIAKWDGVSWTTIINTTNPGEIKAIASFDEDGDGPGNPSVFVGSFGPQGIYRLDGDRWVIPGGGLTRDSAQYMCACLRIIDEDGPGPLPPALFAGGWFTSAGGAPALAVAHWNGQNWSPMGSGIGNGQAIVKDIVAVDYTRGTGAPTIYAYALWPDIPGSSDSGLLRWNPAGTWTSLGHFPLGSTTAPTKLASYNGTDDLPSLYITGPFASVNGIPTFSFARLTCPTCYPNCDASTATPILTANDFQCFLNNFAAASSYANCDGSTADPILTANDFQCFLNQYAAGCN